MLRWHLAAGAAPLLLLLRRVQRLTAPAGGLVELVGKLPGVIRYRLGAVPRPVSVLWM